MKQQDIYEQVKSLIVKGNISEAFDFLKNKKASDALTILESEFHELRNAEIKGTLDTNQIQIKKNQINEKLLSLAKHGNFPNKKITSSNNLWKILIPLVAILIGGFFFWNNQKNESSVSCPSYPSETRNKVLIIPFINVGSTDAQPHFGLRDRINKVASKKNLSIHAELGEEDKNLTMKKAPKLATNCNADMIVWGTFEKSDSLEISVNYYFAHEPQWNKSAELATLKNVSSIYKGNLTKHLEDDVFFSLCSIIVMRDGNNTLAKNWLDKVKNKDEIDTKLLQALN